MKQRLTVSKASITETKLQLEVSESLSGLIPAGQILVDSEQYSFIYLMEDQEDYTYIVLPEQIWSELKSALEQVLPVWLSGSDQELELLHFHDELGFIIGNIKGNSNYGKEMVEKVEEIF
ncbi:hypothetical protein [Neobacillus kokaensis]|uniref:Uncharacterized protein n=1 Tax=Neobacillus kokaensis TaxID=2759023 RepID=A0ABQ3N393_9BACI|nr:hypothetical protein [Neobacillus kokaensis]GHH98458.1 hypothetical protein AM1BK_20010 [Neobacillus kokaensis]